MTRLERMELAARVWPPGSVVYFAIDGAVRRGRVLRVEAAIEAGFEVAQVLYVVRYISAGEASLTTLPHGDVHDSPVLAGNDAFGSVPEPLL